MLLNTGINDGDDEDTHKRHCTGNVPAQLKTNENSAWELAMFCNGL